MNLGSIFKIISNPGEVNAVWRYLGDTPKILVGIGSYNDIDHCLQLGLPNVMVLFDPSWKESWAIKNELRMLPEGIVGKYELIDRVDVELAERLSGGDSVLFSWLISQKSSGDLSIIKLVINIDSREMEKLVFLVKKRYDPAILSEIPVDIIHFGHRGVTMTDDEFLQTMLLMKKGCVFMNYFHVDGWFDYMVVFWFMTVYTEYSPSQSEDSPRFFLCEKDSFDANKFSKLAELNEVVGLLQQKLSLKEHYLRKGRDVYADAEYIELKTKFDALLKKSDLAVIAELYEFPF